MITVKVKEHGATVNFPDDATPEEIKVVIERKFYGKEPDRSLEVAPGLPYPSREKKPFTFPTPPTIPEQPPEDYTTGLTAPPEPAGPSLRIPPPSFPGAEDLARMVPSPRVPPQPRGSTVAAPLEQIPFEAEGIPLQAPTPESLKWLGLPFRPIEWLTEKMIPALPEAAGQEAPMNVREVAGMLAEMPAHIPGFQAGMPEAPARPEAGEANKEILNALGRLAVDAVGWHITGMGMAAALRGGAKLFEDTIRPWVIKERGLGIDPEELVQAARKTYDRTMKVEELMRDPRTPPGERQAAAAAYERITGKRHPMAPPEEPAAGPAPIPPEEPPPAPAPPTGEGRGLAKVIPIRRGEVPREKPTPRTTLSELLDRVANRWKAEEKGQTILDEIEAGGRSPQTVNQEFWTKTYPQLPPEVRRRFELYVQKSTGGMKPGEVLWVDREGNKGIAQDWQHIGLEGLDWPEKVEHVTGTDRGLLALMEHGNRIVAAERAALEGKAPPAPPPAPGPLGLPPGIGPATQETTKWIPAEGKKPPQPPPTPKEPSAAHYPDGRLVPTEGDEVYQVVPGFGGSPAYIHGKVYRTRTNKLRVRTTGTSALIGGGGGGKTYDLNQYWTVKDDPEIARREAAREAATRKEREDREEAERAEKERIVGSVNRALKEGQKPVTVKTVAPGDRIYDHRSQEYTIVTEIEPEKGWIFARPENQPDMAGGLISPQEHTKLVLKPPPVPKPKAEPKTETLFGWVRSKGGLHDPTLKGEVAQFVKEFRIVGLVSKKRGMPLDELAAQAVSEGWLPPEARSGDLVEALKQDIVGIKTGKRWQKRTAEDLDKKMEAQAAAEEEGMVAAAQAKVEEVHTGDLDLKVGDEILVPKPDGGEEWLKVKEHDTEKGVLTLQDGQTIKVSDVFDYVPIVGGEAFEVKRKGEGAPGAEPAAPVAEKQPWKWLAKKEAPKKYTAEVIKRSLPRDMPDDEKDRLAQLLSEQPDEEVAKLLRANLEQMRREAELKQKVKARSTATPQDLFGGTEEAPKGQEDLFGGGKGAASAGTYATGAEGYAAPLKQVIDLPELVELARQLMQGKLPRIVEKIRAHAGQATGIFYPAGLGRILLKADIFKDVAQARAILAHEIGHLADYLPEHMMERGNILGRMAKLQRHMKRTLPRAPGAKTELTEADRVRLRKLAEKLIREEYKDKWIDEEIVKSLPITPDDVLAIWNSVEAALEGNKDLYRFIQTLNTAEKKAIVKQALRGEVAAALQRFAKEVREKTGKKIKAELPADAVSKKYQELIKAEIEKLKLFKAEEIYDELKALTRAWKPFDPSQNAKYTKYRYSGVELYADFVSALFNAPGLAKSMAPNFYEGFFNYLGRNPQFKALYDQIQADIAAGATDEKLTKRTYEMFRKGDDAYALRYKRDYPWFDAFMREFVDVHWVIQRKVKRIGKVTGQAISPEKNPVYKIDGMTYTGSEVEWLLGQTLQNIIRPLEKVGSNWDDFGFYKLLKRVSTERAEIANPLGWHPERAQKKLEAMRQEMGPDKWQALQDADAEFTRIHSYIVEKAAAAGRFDPDLLETMRGNVGDYATFDVVHYIQERHGAGPATKVFPQLGTFAEVSNPATATILKDIAILKAVNRQVAAESTVQFMRENYPLEIRPADKRWNGRFNEIKDPPRGEDLGLIVYLKNGKPQGWYVHKWIADSFERNPIEGWMFAKILSASTKPFRAVFTDANPGFWLFNVIRDTFRAATDLPKAKASTFLAHWGKALRPGFQSVYGIPSDVAEEMMKGNMLISIESVRGMNPEDREIERLLKRYQLMGPKAWHENVIRPFGEMYNWWTNIGRALERTTKIAGYMHLKKQFPDAPEEWIRHMVINRAGSPNFLAVGRAYPIYNNLLLFSNAQKEGMRSDYSAAAENPAEWWWKKMKYILFSKILMRAASIGLLGTAFASLFGPEAKKVMDGVKMVMDGVTKFDEANYHIIPLGLTPTGKSVYLRVPMDESGRLIGGLMTKLMDRDDPHYVQDLIDYMAGQAPTLNPMIDVMVSVVRYASGQNPYDAFRGQYAIPEQVFQARDEHTHKAFLKWLANKSGSSIVYRFQNDDIDRVRGELQKVLNFPFVGNIFGRFIKISEAGVKEDFRLAREIGKVEDARASLDAKDALTKWINEEPLTQEDLTALAMKPDTFDRNYFKFFAKRYGDVLAEELWSVMQTGSTMEKYRVFEKLQQIDATDRANGKYRWLWTGF